MGINNDYTFLQMFDDNWWDNFAIYYVNITWFYTVSMILGWLAVGLSSWKYLTLGWKKQNTDREKNKEATTIAGSTGFFSLQTQYKLAKQKIAEKHLTPEQRSEEKEAEVKQLAAILKLLQEQSETFQVASMDQLENQLRLYRS